MSDEVDGVLEAPEQEGTPEPQLPVYQGEQAQSEDAKPVTQAELRASISSLTDEMKRMIQSLTDKQESRLRKELDAKMKPFDEMLQQSGLSDEDKTELRRQAIKEEIMRSYREGQKPAQASSPAPEVDATVKAVSEQAAAILQSLGIEEADWSNDVWKKVKTDGTAKEYLSTLRAAALEIVAAEKGNPEHSPGIVKGAGSGDLMVLYQQEMKMARPGSAEAINIRRKYREKGLPI